MSGKQSDVPGSIDDHKVVAFFKQRPNLPLVGVQDAPVRCYKINEQWSKYIAGMMSELLNIQAWADATDERAPQIQSLIQVLIGEACVNCDDVEDCLETSTTITNININIDTLEQQLEDVPQDDTQGNIFPPPPDFPVGGQLCSSAVYIAQKLSEHWHNVLADAQTITFQEFIEALLLGGGADANLVKLLWDFVVSNANPNLQTEGENAFDEVVGYLYCNQLDRDLTDLDIDASSTMSGDAKALWRGALASFTDGKLALWAYVGSLQGLTNPECCCDVLCRVFNFVEEDGCFDLLAIPSNAGQWLLDIGWVGQLTQNPIGGQRRSVFIGQTYNTDTVQTLRVTFDYERGTWINPQTDTAIQFKAMLNAAVIAQHAVQFQNTTEGDNQIVDITVNDQMNRIELLMSASTYSGPPPPDTGKAIIKSVEVIC